MGGRENRKQRRNEKKKKIIFQGVCKFLKSNDNVWARCIHQSRTKVVKRSRSKLKVCFLCSLCKSRLLSPTEGLQTACRRIENQTTHQPASLEHTTGTTVCLTPLLRLRKCRGILGTVVFISDRQWLTRSELNRRAGNNWEVDQGREEEGGGGGEQAGDWVGSRKRGQSQRSVLQWFSHHNPSTVESSNSAHFCCRDLPKTSTCNSSNLLKNQSQSASSRDRWSPAWTLFIPN